MSISFGSSSRAASVGLRIWLPLIALLFFPSCDLFEDDTEGETAIRFISFVSGGPVLNVQIDGETIQAAAFAPALTPVGPSGVPTFSAVESGRRRYQVRQATTAAEVIHQGTLTLTADSVYTAYLTGETDNVSVSLVGEGDITAPNEGAVIRIVHAYPRVGQVEGAIHEVQPSPGGGLDAGALIDTVEGLSHGETSELVQTVEGQIAVVVSAAGRQSPMLLISPVEGRLYTIVITQPSGVFGSLNFGLGVYQEEL